MIITRTINGVEFEFELNSQELYEAYMEQQHKWDINFVRNLTSCNYNYDLTDDEVSAVAREARRQADKYDLDFDFATAEALLEFDFEEEAS